MPTTGLAGRHNVNIADFRCFTERSPTPRNACVELAQGRVGIDILPKQIRIRTTLVAHGFGIRDRAVTFFTLQERSRRPVEQAM